MYTSTESDVERRWWARDDKETTTGAKRDERKNTTREVISKRKKAKEKKGMERERECESALDVDHIKITLMHLRRTNKKKTKSEAKGVLF